MVISELIEQLRDYPAGLRVVVDGYEEGYDDLSPEQISTMKISLNTGTHSCGGLHGDPCCLKQETLAATKVVKALVLSRVSN